jgi:hypothetical protein
MIMLLMCVLCCSENVLHMVLIFWSYIMLVAFWSVIKAAYWLLRYTVSPDMYEIGWWSRCNKEEPLEGGQMHE